MSEQPLPEPERAEVRKFFTAYKEALDKARVSEEHTATQGWQDLYGDHRNRIQTIRIDLSDRLKSLAEAARMRVLTEEEEKALADIKKDSVAARMAEDFFQAQILDPIMAPLHECEQVIEQARASARNDERTTPLHVRGLVQAIEEAIDTVPKPKFILASGRLVIG